MDIRKQSSMIHFNIQSPASYDWRNEILINTPFTKIFFSILYSWIIILYDTRSCVQIYCDCIHMSKLIEEYNIVLCTKNVNGVRFNDDCDTHYTFVDISKLKNKWQQINVFDYLSFSICVSNIINHREKNFF